MTQTRVHGMPHVTYIIDNLLRAGTQTVLGYLVAGLAERGYSQEVFCLNRRFDPQVIAHLEAAGAQVTVLGRVQLATGYGLGKLFAALRRSDVLQTFLPASDIVGRAIGRLAKTPRVVTSIRARNIDKRPWQLWLDRVTMSWADHVIFNAQAVVEFSLRNEGVRPEQVVVVPNGVKLSPSPEDRRSLLEALELPDAPMIGTVGRLRPQKGHAFLIEALARIRDRTPAHLLLIGEGELREALERQVLESGLADRVHFLGVRADLTALYAALDVYAHPALFEGLPNAVMEALAAGVPVVATAVDGTMELIRDGEIGWLVPPGDAGSLGRQLLEILENPALARRVARAGRAYIRENYSIEKMVSGFDAVYRGTGRHHADQ